MRCRSWKCTSSRARMPPAAPARPALRALLPPCAMRSSRRLENAFAASPFAKKTWRRWDRPSPCVVCHASDLFTRVARDGLSQTRSLTARGSVPSPEREGGAPATEEIPRPENQVNMKMHNPPHPGEVLKTLCLESLNLTITEAARSFGISRKTLSGILNARAGISPEMAVRLSIAFNTECGALGQSATSV